MYILQERQLLSALLFLGSVLLSTASASTPADLTGPDDIAVHGSPFAERVYDLVFRRPVGPVGVDHAVSWRVKYKYEPPALKNELVEEPCIEHCGPKSINQFTGVWTHMASNHVDGNLMGRFEAQVKDKWSVQCDFQWDETFYTTGSRLKNHGISNHCRLIENHQQELILSDDDVKVAWLAITPPPSDEDCSQDTDEPAQSAQRPTKSPWATRIYQIKFVEEHGGFSKNDQITWTVSYRWTEEEFENKLTEVHCKQRGCNVSKAVSNFATTFNDAGNGHLKGQINGSFFATRPDGWTAACTLSWDETFNSTSTSLDNHGTANWCTVFDPNHNGTDIPRDVYSYSWSPVTLPPHWDDNLKRDAAPLVTAHNAEYRHVSPAEAAVARDIFQKDDTKVRPLVIRSNPSDFGPVPYLKPELEERAETDFLNESASISRALVIWMDKSWAIWPLEKKKRKFEWWVTYHFDRPNIPAYLDHDFHCAGTCYGRKAISDFFGDHYNYRPASIASNITGGFVITYDSDWSFACQFKWSEQFGVAATLLNTGLSCICTSYNPAQNGTDLPDDVFHWDFTAFWKTDVNKNEYHYSTRDEHGYYEYHGPTGRLVKRILNHEMTGEEAFHKYPPLYADGVTKRSSLSGTGILKFAKSHDV